MNTRWLVTFGIVSLALVGVSDQQDWPLFRGSYNPSSLVYGGYYYTLHDRKFLTANDAKTGKEIYGRQRIAPDAGGFSASPWAYNGKIFALSEDGDTFAIAAAPEFRQIGKSSIDERTLAMPALADYRIIMRTASSLVRIARPR